MHAHVQIELSSVFVSVVHEKDIAPKIIVTDSWFNMSGYIFYCSEILPAIILQFKYIYYEIYDTSKLLIKLVCMKTCSIAKKNIRKFKET